MLSSAKQVISAAGLLKFPPNGAARRPATSGPEARDDTGAAIAERDRGGAHMCGE